MKRILFRLKDEICKRIDFVKWARTKGVKIGEDCRLLGVTFSSEPYLVEIGNHVSATKVHFETHDGGVWLFRDKHPSIDLVKPIKVGDNVYLGMDVLILPGVSIGNNVIVGARSVVTKDIPDNSVVVGSPARVIKSTDEYYNKVIAQSLETKNMLPSEKKQYYVKYYMDK